MSANKKLKTCIGKPKEECPSPTPHPRATTAAVKVNESLSLFLTVTAPDGVLRHINSFWIGFRDEDQYYRSLTPLECVGRWVLASLYAAKIDVCVMQIAQKGLVVNSRQLLFTCLAH